MYECIPFIFIHHGQQKMKKKILEMYVKSGFLVRLWDVFYLFCNVIYDVVEFYYYFFV
jgi:hypothetical protein